MTARTVPVTLTPLLGFPEVHKDDDLVGILVKALQDNGIELIDGDILVMSSKVTSKAMGLSAPSRRRADAVDSQTVRVVAERMTAAGVTRIVESAAGPVMTAAGVDASNTGGRSIVLILPGDPDGVAAQIRDGVLSGWLTKAETAPRIGVVLSDTAGRPWRFGQTDFALGAAGIHVVDDLRGSSDTDGRVLSVTQRSIADEIAAAADLVKGKATGTPAAHIRGLGQFVHDGPSHCGARDLVRTGPDDWFGLGQAEAVRAALGVQPGSAEATVVGIRPVGSETLADKANRALRVALLLCPEASGQVDGSAIRLVAADNFALGVLATRAQVALHGEGLSATVTRSPVPALAAGEMSTALPSAVIAFE